MVSRKILLGYLVWLKVKAGLVCRATAILRRPGLFPVITVVTVRRQQSTHTHTEKASVCNHLPKNNI